MKKNFQDNQKSKVDKNLIFVACIILGTGIGMAFNDVAIGAIIGVGIGFLFKALLR